MPPSPCPNGVDHHVEWDERVIDRCVCVEPGCGLVYPYDPPPLDTRHPYKDPPD